MCAIKWPRNELLEKNIESYDDLLKNKQIVNQPTINNSLQINRLLPCAIM